MIKSFIQIAFVISILSTSFQDALAQMSELPKISGLILEKGTGKRLADVNILNTNTNKREYTNNFGVFYLEASVGDTLSISKVGYGPLKTVIFTREDILLEMQPGMQIEEVVIARRTREQEMQDILDDYAKKGIYNGGKNRAGTYLNSPATALYNLFGREAKNMKRFEKFMDRELEAIELDKIFSKSAVMKTTGLEGQDLINFMELYRPSFQVAKSWGQYDLIDYITRSFKYWNEQGRPEPVKLPKLDIPSQN